MKEATEHVVEARFPRDGITVSCDNNLAGVRARFPAEFVAKATNVTVMKISLKEGQECTINGYGMPYANLEDEEQNGENAKLAGWVNGGQPIVGSHTLSGILRSREFCFVVCAPPEGLRKRFAMELEFRPPFSYPYGTDHSWNVEKFKELLQKHKSTRNTRPPLGKSHP